MDVLLLLSRFALAMVFAVAALAKLRDPDGTAETLHGFGVAPRAARLGARVLPWSELAVAALLVPGVSASLGGASAAALLASFSVAMGVSLVRGRRPMCHCFGRLSTRPIGWGSLVRNALLLSMAGAVAWQGAGAPPSDLLAATRSLSPAERLALGVTSVNVLLVVAAGWLFLQMLAQNGRILARLDQLSVSPAGASDRQGEAAPVHGLAVGSPAPEFVAHDLTGERRELGDLLAAGKPGLLFFADPECGPCRVLLPEVLAWGRKHAARASLAVVSGGDLERLRAEADGADPKRFWAQEGRAVAEAFLAYGTPSAVRIEANGTIGSPLALGAEAIRSLLARVAGPAADRLIEPLPVGPTTLPSPKRSLISGAPVPDLSLRSLSGEEVRLAQPGRASLLLFWNPSCGFCQQMQSDLPVLERMARTAQGRLLVLSSSPPPSGTAGLEGWALDPHGEAAEAFEARGTPMAVWVDDTGRLASALAVGRTEILRLAEVWAQQQHDQGMVLAVAS
jgi:thiol-disulfide isomerase/thioredoxin